MVCYGIVMVRTRIYRSDIMILYYNFVFFGSFQPQFEKYMTRDDQR